MDWGNSGKPSRFGDRRRNKNFAMFRPNSKNQSIERRRHERLPQKVQFDDSEAELSACRTAVSRATFYNLVQATPNAGKLIQ